MARITLNEALADYYDVRAPRYGDATWRAHEGQLERFRTWATREWGPNLLITDVDERGMARYFNKVRAEVEPSSFNNYRQYLNMFWRFARGEGWVETNPMRHVDAERPPRKVRLRLSAEELLAILDDAEPHDRIFLACGENTALRAQDIAVLTVGSVNLGNNTLLAWISKTKTWEELPVTAELRAEIIRWLQHYGPAMGVPDWRDVPNEWTLCPPVQSVSVNPHRPDLGRRLMYKTTGRQSHPERIVQRVLARRGYPTKGQGLHTLRRSTARALYDLAASDGIGDPIRIPQALLGHRNRQTTEIYLGVTHEKQLRDELMRGQSFLGRAAATEAADRRQSEGEGGRRATA